ncbi:hypothetical protein [Burkholderia sp. ABCPW 14]|uniref:hypothetical protein n=1 Tax=Burkholderia sp. ABCPW 14 TaxID=1637860 RepID=UPI000ADAD80A|nr:hypothetical protein [Burkholderia sp. ABCPW 14]
MLKPIQHALRHIIAQWIGARRDSACMINPSVLRYAERFDAGIQVSTCLAHGIPDIPPHLVNDFFPECWFVANGFVIRRFSDPDNRRSLRPSIFRFRFSYITSSRIGFGKAIASRLSPCYWIAIH